MTRIGLVHAPTGELRVMDATAWAELQPGTDIGGWTEVPVPAEWPETIEWRQGAFVPKVRALWPEQILALYTVAQRGRARRMLTAVHPPGHVMAGQLIDPDASVQALLDALLAHRDPVPLDSSWHIQGTALMRGLGVIESDAEAARILAGIAAGEPQ